jgi:DegV family protein with EDD domain
MAERYGIHIVPMHVSFDGSELDDGTFPVEDVSDYYQRNGRPPATSGCSPVDFNKVFDRIHAQFPKKQILHLAYSAVTTCSYQSALLAAENRDYVTSFDTRQVSGGQAAVVLEMARLLEEKPHISLDAAIEAARDLRDRSRLCFLPDKLDYLRAGGRMSNVAFLGGLLLRIHPCVEILNGRLVATRKYRGSLRKLAARLVHDFAQSYQLDKKRIWLLKSFDLSKQVIEAAQDMAEKCGFKQISWLQGGCVITAHAGTGTFGMTGFTESRA